MFGGGGSRKGAVLSNSVDQIIERMGKSLQEPAGILNIEEDSPNYIPQVPLHESDGRSHKRILM